LNLDDSEMSHDHMPNICIMVGKLKEMIKILFLCVRARMCACQPVSVNMLNSSSKNYVFFIYTYCYKSWHLCQSSSIPVAYSISLPYETDFTRFTMGLSLFYSIAPIGLSLLCRRSGNSPILKSCVTLLTVYGNKFLYWLSRAFVRLLAIYYINQCSSYSVIK
jgi:hypothetical protein